MTTGRLHVNVADTIATLTIDNVRQRNAMTAMMWDELPRTLAQLDLDDNVSVLLVRGAGAHFSAGAEIGDLRVILADSSPVHGNRVSTAESALAAFSKPTLAVIDGFCVGGGWEIAGACDIRISTNRAIFGVTPAKLGVLYPLSGLRRLVEITGAAPARHLLLTGELVSASTACRWGMVSETVSPELLWDRALALASMLASRSRLTQQASTELIGLIANDDERLGERAAFWAAEAAASEDSAIGANAFLQKVAPVFTWVRSARQ